MLSLMPNCSRELGAQTYRIEENLKSIPLWRQKGSWTCLQQLLLRRLWVAESFGSHAWQQPYLFLTPLFRPLKKKGKKKEGIYYIHTNHIDLSIISISFHFCLPFGPYCFSSAWCIDMHHSLAMRQWKLTRIGLPENGYKHRRIRTESTPTTNARGVGIGCTGLTNG